MNGHGVRLSAALALACSCAIARADGPPPTPPPAPAPSPSGPSFLGTPDDEILKRLCEQPIAKLKANYQGTTIKFKATMADGTVGSLRPAQVNEAGYWRADIAAYRVSRALGLGTVAPACERTVTREEISAGAPPKILARLEKEVKWSADGKTVLASVVAWVDKVQSAELEKSRSEWRPLLSQKSPLTAAEDVVTVAAEGSRLITFDYLIANWDRWSGANTFRVGRHGPYVWLDNAAGFGHYSPAMRKRNESELRDVERFSRRFVEALRGASEDALTVELRAAGLSDRERSDFLGRRRDLLARIDELTKRYSDKDVLPFE
jgi:hypothetical protein